MQDTNGYPSDTKEKVDSSDENASIGEGDVINASGHKDQLKRHFGLLSICGLALTVDNAWVALGTSLTVAISKEASSATTSFLADSL